ncbi:MAG TPA: hypothetical protein VMM12_14245, partial [Longimicrobiales bacterium]|nr:hypothetical protein [Longimicrobiales bacterium]
RLRGLRPLRRNRRKRSRAGERTWYYRRVVSLYSVMMRRFGNRKRYPKRRSEFDSPIKCSRPIKLPWRQQLARHKDRAMTIARIEFWQLPLWVRIAVALTFFNTWVLIAEFVIDRYGIDEYLPFYRYGDVCIWEIAVLLVLVFWFVRSSRVPRERLPDDREAAQ